MPPFEKTYGPDVGEFCHSIEYGPDPEQQLALDCVFARRDDGLSAAFETAVIVGRQNIKTGTFKMIDLAWMFVFHEPLVIWSAHEFLTAEEAQRDLETIILNWDFLRREVKRISHGNGDEQIELLDGCRTIFKTRTKGGGRGLSSNKLILDEGMFLRASHMGALIPTFSAQPDPQVVYGASAGMSDSDVLRDMRDRGRDADPRGKKRLAYIEYCAPDPAVTCDAGDKCSHVKSAVGCGCDKAEFVSMANPAFGRRRPNGTGLSWEYIQAERQAMPVDEYCRERMGWWDDPEEGVTPLSLLAWYGPCCDRKSRVDAKAPIAVGLAVAPDSSMSAIAVAGWRPDGRSHWELAEHLPGTAWLMDSVDGIVGRRNPVVTCFDPASMTGAWERDMRNRGYMTKPKDEQKPLLVPAGKKLMHICSQRDYAQGCGMIQNGVANETARHIDQAPVNDAVEAARKRTLAQAWVWDTTAGHDITPLVAITMANLGLETYGKRPGLVPFALT